MKIEKNRTNQPVYKFPFALVFAILAMVTITYSNHFNNSFHFDDSHTIINNIFIRDINNIPKFFIDGTTFSSLPSNQSYRPIVTTTLAIDYYFSGGLENKFYFHLSTFIFYLLQLILMYFLLLKIFQDAGAGSKSISLSLFGIAWYGLHPANAETINYVIARSDSISTFFVVLAFVQYIYSAVSRKYYLYLLPVFIGALAKPTTIMFAPILFMYVALFEEKTNLFKLFSKESISKLLQSFRKSLPSFIACVLFYFFIQSMEPKTWSPGGTSKFLYMITQPYIMMHYIYTFFLPLELSADTDWGIFQSLNNPKAILGFVGLITLVTAVLFFSKDKKTRPISFGVAWFLLALVPTSVVPLAEVMNDHRIFYPFVGLLISVVWLFYLGFEKLENTGKNKTRSTILLILVIVGLEAYAMGTYQRNAVWKTDESLWKDVSIKSPNNARGLMNYGLTQMSKGDYNEAEKYFLRGIELWPGYAVLYLNMAILKEGQNKLDDAGTFYQKALSIGLRNPSQHYFYGRYLRNRGKLNEAIIELEKSLQLSPAFADSRYLLMSIYADQFEWEKLKSCAEKTLELMPNDAKGLQYLEQSKNKKSKLESLLESAKTKPTPEKYLDLSLYYYQIGNFGESILAAKEALKLKPNYPEAYNNICSANNELKNYEEAKKACEEAIRLNPDYQLAKNNLNWALKQRIK